MSQVSEQITIRRGRDSDLQAVTELWRSMMDMHVSLDPRFEVAVGSDDAYKAYLRTILDTFDYALFVADLEGVAIGYCIGMILNNPAVFALPRYGFISECMVAEPYQRDGIGARLWEHVRRWFKRRGMTVIQLNVTPRNEKGYHFWQKVGCTEFLHIMWYDIPERL